MLVTLAQPLQAISTTSENSLEAQVGNTPLLCLQKTAVAAGLPETVQLYAKAEWFNPSGSVKDRAALNIIRTAEEQGYLWPGKTILDSTSGNMGIAYAMFGAARGYRVKLVVPSSASAERLAILKGYGAELIFSDGAAGSDGAMTAVRQLATENPHWFYANQYDNPANWQAYYLSMADEVWQQTDGRVTHFVAGLGSSGTFMGTTRRLRELNPHVTCVSVQAQSAKEGIKGMKHMPSAIKPRIYDDVLADANTHVNLPDAYEMMRFLARREGIFVGPSAAAAVVATVHVAQQLRQGVVVTVLPDNSYKYLSGLNEL